MTFASEQDAQDDQDQRFSFQIIRNPPTVDGLVVDAERKADRAVFVDGFTRAGKALAK